jgi:hypothetical protein
MNPHHMRQQYGTRKLNSSIIAPDARRHFLLVIILDSLCLLLLLRTTVSRFSFGLNS